MLLKTGLIQHLLFPVLLNMIKFLLAKLWHLRLSHMPFSQFQHLLPHLDVPHCIKSCICQVCPLVRQPKLSFHISEIKSVKPFQLLHLDVWGPYHTVTHNGCSFFLTVVDDFTRCTWIHLMKYKSELVPIFTDFLQYIQTQFHSCVQHVRTDNAKELCDGAMKTLYLTKGIHHQRSSPDSPQQNGVVERKHRHLLNTARGLTFQSNIPLK